MCLVLQSSHTLSLMSALLSADDLNDFISPGVACIKPVEFEPVQDPGRARIEIGDDLQPMEVDMNAQKTALKPAQISLSDCLACSGCITSAEEVLVSMQSHSEVLDQLKKNDGRVFVASIAPQTRVSLATAYNIPLGVLDGKLKELLLSVLGFKSVVGTETGRQVSLKRVGKEALERGSAGASGGPVLCASCPGWTCYVEKTHPFVIPYLSNVKSPQQITGELLKKMVATQYNVDVSKVYHLSVMPCFDKKLEAARPEFGSGSDYRDVDCVITPKEIVQLLESIDVDFMGLSEYSGGETAPFGWPKDHWLSNSGSSSGGYMDHVLLQYEMAYGKECEVKEITGKNSDYVEYQLIASDTGSVVCRAAQVYGFRNIQNLVRKLKTKGKVSKLSKKASTGVSDPSSLNYVEVMACPGGCINGGGQIGAPEGVNSREWKDRKEALYMDLAKTGSESEAAEALVERMHVSCSAEFRAVEKDESVLGLGTKW